MKARWSMRKLSIKKMGMSVLHLQGTRKVLVTQLCLTLYNPMDCSPPGSSVRGILQVTIVEWVAIPFSRESFQPRGQTWIACIAGSFFAV